MRLTDHSRETSPKLNFCSSKTGQVGAIRLGISRALQNFEPGLRPYLKAGKIGFHHNPFSYSPPNNPLNDCWHYELAPLLLFWQPSTSKVHWSEYFASSFYISICAFWKLLISMCLCQKQLDIWQEIRVWSKEKSLERQKQERASNGSSGNR